MLPAPGRLVALLPALFLLAAAPPAHAGITLSPGDTLRFIGADIQASTSGNCNAVNDCGVNFEDIGEERPRMTVFSNISVGFASIERRASGRLLYYFTLAGDNEHRIGAKLHGRVTWRGWLLSDFGAWSNNSTVDIAVAIYDVTTATVPGDLFDNLVGRQTVYTNSVSGSLTDAPVPTYERAIGTGSFNLAVDLYRGHTYVVAVEGTCRSTSGPVGIATASSFSPASLVPGSPPIDDGYIERTLMIMRVEPDYLELIDELRESFEGHRHEYLTGRGEGHNNTQAETSGPLDESTAASGRSGRDLGRGAFSPALDAILVAPGRVRLGARLPAGANGGALIERGTDGAHWTALGMAGIDGEWEDTGVEAGVRYAYRARCAVNGVERVGGPLWIEVPAALGFALDGARPNPTSDEITAHFMLPDAAAATLELFDLAGRQVLVRDVGALGPGRHAARLAGRGDLPAGVYLLRLTRGGESRSSRVTVLQ